MSWQTNKLRGLRLLLVTALALAFAMGCSKGCGSADEDQPAPSASASAAAPQAASLPLDQLKPPPAALVYGGGNSPLELVGALKLFLGDAAPPALDAKAVASELAQLLGLQSPDPLDLAKPTRAAVFDPKRHQQPMAYVTGIKDQAELVASLPANKKQNDAGNSYSYLGANGTCYVNFIPGSVVLTHDPTVFGTYKRFIEQLAAAKLPDQVAFVVSMKNVMALYGADIDAAVRQVKAQMEGLQPSAGMAGQQQAAQFGAVMDWMVSAGRDLDQLVVYAKFPASGARVSLELRPMPATAFHKTASILGGQDFKLLKRMPANAPLFLAVSLNPDQAGETASRIVRWSFTMGLGSLELPDKFIKAAEDYWKASTGESVFVVHEAPGGKGLALSGLYGVRDAAQARPALRTMFELYRDPELKKLAESLKMKITHQSAAYKVGELEVDQVDITLDPAVMAALGKNEPIGSLVRDLLHTHAAMSDELAIIGYGGDAKATITAFLGNQLSGGLAETPGVKRALASVAPGCFLLVYLRPAELAQRLDLGGQNPFAAVAAQMPATTSGVALSASAKDGVLTVVLDVPAEQVGAVTRLAGLLGGMLVPPGGPPR